MSNMPDKGHCACKFSSGGVLSKSCQWHNAMAEDAARYRWLANNESYHIFVSAETKEELDAAIDAEIAAIREGANPHTKEK